MADDRETLQDGSGQTDAERAEEIKRESAEGMPAFPRVGPRGIWFMLLGGTAAIVVTALVLAATESAWLGVLAGFFGLVLFAFSPTVWANIFRAKERARVDRRLSARRAAEEAAAEGEGVKIGGESVHEVDRRG